MAKKSKNPGRTTTTTTEDPRLYAHSYAARLEKQVAQELGTSRPGPTPRKKKVRRRQS